jgi:hypothetical protein
MYRMMVLFGSDKAPVVYYRAGSLYLLGFSERRLAMLNSLSSGE